MDNFSKKKEIDTNPNKLLPDLFCYPAIPSKDSSTESKSLFYSIIKWAYQNPYLVTLIVLVLVGVSLILHLIIAGAIAGAAFSYLVIAFADLIPEAIAIFSCAIVSLLIMAKLALTKLWNWCLSTPSLSKTSPDQFEDQKSTADNFNDKFILEVRNCIKSINSTFDNLFAWLEAHKNEGNEGLNDDMILHLRKIQVVNDRIDLYGYLDFLSWFEDLSNWIKENAFLKNAFQPSTINLTSPNQLQQFLSSIEAGLKRDGVVFNLYYQIIKRFITAIDRCVEELRELNNSTYTELINHLDVVSGAFQEIVNLANRNPPLPQPVFLELENRIKEGFIPKICDTDEEGVISAEKEKSDVILKKHGLYYLASVINDILEELQGQEDDVKSVYSNIPESALMYVVPTDSNSTQQADPVFAAPCQSSSSVYSH